MLYHPKGRHVWDTWCFQAEGKLRCVHLQYVPEGVDDPVEAGALWQAETEDLIHWETLPTALYRNPVKGAVDDRELWTGSVMEKNGVYYLFYTARSSAEDAQVNRIALATSLDGVSWTRYPDNPILIPDGRWYVNEHQPLKTYGHGHFIVDCRDLCVVEDPEGQGYWGFFAARRPSRTNASSSVIGLCHSDDLIHWTQYPPCFEPVGFGCVEVPDVFYLDGKWYMLCLTGNDYGNRTNVSDPLICHATIYAVADRVQGPYRMMEDDNVLIGSIRPQGYSAKTVAWGDERIAYYTQRGGFACISLPHVLKTDGRGALRAHYHSAVDRVLQPVDEGQSLHTEGGQWGSLGDWAREGDSVTGQCDEDWAVYPLSRRLASGKVEVRITFDTARAAGIAFHLPGEDIMAGGMLVLLDARDGFVEYTRLRQFPLVERRAHRIERGRTYRLSVVMAGDKYMAYLDDELILQFSEDKYPEGICALFVERGAARFDGLRLSEWIEK